MVRHLGGLLLLGRERRSPSGPCSGGPPLGYARGRPSGGRSRSGARSRRGRVCWTEAMGERLFCLSRTAEAEFRLSVLARTRRPRAKGARGPSPRRGEPGSPARLCPTTGVLRRTTGWLGMREDFPHPGVGPPHPPQELPGASVCHDCDGRGGRAGSRDRGAGVGGGEGRGRENPTRPRDAEAPFCETQGDEPLVEKDEAGTGPLREGSER